jgi:acyl transferase domain-containing protein/SAM-dependent methyltransferase/acyl carrier protein
MKEFLQRIEKLSPQRLALLALDQQMRLEKLERSWREPVAIVGIGCRFPGDVDGPDSFWKLLIEKRDAITEVPFERWDVNRLFDPDPDKKGKISTRWGGFLRHVDRFDAAFFGISRREATSMDPQQRMLLETSWEALEHAGVAPRSLSGSQLGIFFGLATADYYQLLMQGGRESVDGYTSTGSAHSIAAGRLAYVLGVHGPNMALDTACSSSLVAVHLACQSLRSGECEMALAGGANVILSPETTIALSRARMLSPDGRCKAFDSAADGFVRSEGCGVIVLKLLSRALNERDHIVAVIRGSAINQDGRSSGLTAPNGIAQENVIRQAMRAAGVTSSEVQYVEAHGKGTSLGDPIEAHALAAAVGAGRGPENPLYVGSLKTNIGHLEAAAGIAGVIKTALSLQRGIIPANLHFSRLNPHIDLNEAPLLFPTSPVRWPGQGRRIAGISSFGFSGANGHAILEGPPLRSQAAEGPPDSYALVLSARTPTALRTLARRYQTFLEEHPDAPLRDFCYTADTGRSRFELVHTVAGANSMELRRQLAGVADETQALEISGAAAKTSGSKIPIPTYPFERQRYWVEAQPPEPAAVNGDVGFYRLEWKAKSGRAESAASPRDTTAIARAIAPLFPSLSREHGLDRYAVLRPQLERLSFEFIVRALRELGWNPTIGETVVLEALAARLGIRQRYWRSVRRMLEIVAEEGILESRGASWIVRRLPQPADPLSKFDALQSEYPGFKGELIFLRRCGTDLASALRGRADPLNLLFPDVSFETAEDLYERSAGAQVFQRMIQEAVASAVDCMPAGRKVRILEVGAGTGGTASYVARVLAADRTEYTFTDVSPLFAARAAEKFRQYPFFRFDVLDIERDPQSQGFEPNGFDIVIAANSLHATSDLRRSLNHVLKLLAPNGMLVLLEGARPERWVDISFGLTEGWWKFTDLDLRSTYPLLSRDGWLKLLADAGLQQIAALPPDLESQQALLLARAPESHGERQGWAIIADSGRVGPLVSALLANKGRRAVLIKPGDAIPFDEIGPRGVVDLSCLDAPAAEQLTDTQWSHVQQFGCEPILTLAQKLVGRETRLWVVTRGAQQVGGEDKSIAIVAAPVWGLGRSIALEHPEIWGGLVDLDPEASDERQAEVLVSSLMTSDGEDQIAFRKDTRYVARLRPCNRPTAGIATLHADACYLITGGLGGLGLLVARWMAEHGARRLILVGRNGVTRPSQAATLREVEQLGASVRMIQTDLANPAQAEQLFSVLAAEEPPLKGVVHAAAELSRDSVREMRGDTFRAVLLPKIAATWLLHRHTRNLSLDFLCLFSSTASILGSGNLAHYAAANQFLDAFAHYRRLSGLPAVAIEWGTWDEMRTVSEESRKKYRSLGLLPMASSQALAAMGDLLQYPESSIMAAAVNWRTLKAVFETRRRRPLLEETEMDAPSLREYTAVSPAISNWENMPAADREARITGLVWEETQRVLQIDAGVPMELDRGFFEMGMDSLVSVELRTRLEARLGRSLPAMMTFNFPTVRALSSRIAAEFNASHPSHSGNGTQSALPAAENLDDDEIARLLAEKLRGIQNRRGGLNSR